MWFVNGLGSRMVSALRLSSSNTEQQALTLLTPKVKFWDIFLLMIVAIIAAVIALVLATSYSLSPFLTAIFAATVHYICWIAGYQMLSRSRGWDGLQIRFAPIGRRIMLASAAGAIALVLLTAAAAAVLDTFGIKTDIRPKVVMPSDLGQLPLAIISIVIVGPLGEELLFRGLLLDWLRQKMAAWPAILIVSLLFAFIHNPSLKSGIAGWMVFGHLFLLGVATGFLALQYKSLRASFVLHATNNGIACIASVLSPFLKGS
jgi:membrane protease YdiL (CAAX protease family)